VQETVSLGLPSLPAAARLNDPFSALTGTHQYGIWYASPARFRLAEQGSMSETDLRRDGSKLWLWNSRTQTATRVLLPGQARGNSGSFRPLPAGPLSSPATIRALLAVAGRSTLITVGQNTTVAGRPAYQLVIKPKTGKSLIGRIDIAIDAARHIPVRLEVFARAAAQPAVQIGYTALTFGRPAPSNFSFSPPPGAKVRTVRAAALLPFSLPAATAGQLTSPPAGSKASSVYGWYVVPGVATTHRVAVYAGGKQVQLTPAALRKLLTRLPKSERPALRRALKLRLHFSFTSPQQLPSVVRGQLQRLGVLGAIPQAQAAARPTLVGKGWLAVLRTAPVAGLAQLIQQLSGKQAITSAYTSTGPTSNSALGAGPATADLGLLRALVEVATPVHGNWGSGRLLRTSLVSVLFTSSGRVLIGAVTPSVLYADAAG
jgi:outer membrane lipoprotein-sorting protein